MRCDQCGSELAPGAGRCMVCGRALAAASGQVYGMVPAATQRPGRALGTGLIVGGAFGLGSGLAGTLTNVVGLGSILGQVSNPEITSYYMAVYGLGIGQELCIGIAGVLAILCGAALRGGRSGGPLSAALVFSIIYAGLAFLGGFTFMLLGFQPIQIFTGLVSGIRNLLQAGIPAVALLAIKSALKPDR